MRWLVISDIHFSNLGYSTEKLRSSLLETLQDLSKSIDFILITGDCFYQNNADGDTLQDMEQFIRSIGKSCGVQMPKVYLCRGNHDIDRDNEKRNSIVAKNRENGSIDLETYSFLYELGSENFRALYSLVKRNTRYKPFTVYQPRKIDARIVSIDTCLLSKDDDDAGNLRVCVPDLDKVGKQLKDDGKLNIVMMHHGIDSLSPGDARSFEHWIEDNHIDIVFSGHTHRAAVDHLNDVNRDILQFTSGALVIDDYAIPSFYVCEGNCRNVEVWLHTFSKKTEKWILDAHHLRKFVDGKYAYQPSRACHMNTAHDVSYAVNSDASLHAARPLAGLVSGRLACEEVIRVLNTRYREKFGTRKIISSKTEGNEDFNAWKIVGSLASVGIKYPVALMLACEAVDELTSNTFEADALLTSTQIKHVVYRSILNCKSYPQDISEYEIGVWASKYARHYDKEKGFVLIDGIREENLSYTLVRDRILRDAVVRVTDDVVYYEKCSYREKAGMTNTVMSFVKSLGIFEIRYEVLLELVAEYMTERPHPWFVTRNRNGIISYHLERADAHMRNITDDVSGSKPVIQIESAYHLCSALLARYDEYTGCKEISPIMILHSSLKRVDEQSDQGLPMLRYRLVQLEKDLNDVESSVADLADIVGALYHNIVEMKSVTSEESARALKRLRFILDKLPQHVESWSPESGRSAFDSVRTLFYNAEGFSTKRPLRHFNGNAFYVDPHWLKKKTSSYNLSDTILVVMLTVPTAAPALNGTTSYADSATIKELVSYLSMENKWSTGDVVLFKDDVAEFTPFERSAIRSVLASKGIVVRCIFIQERDFALISKNGWRDELLKVIAASRYSK